MFTSQLTKTLGAALALAATTSACHKHYSFEYYGSDDDKGKPLTSLDLSGPPPYAISLAGPDKVLITTGEKWAIRVDGDTADADQLRFTLQDGTLGIHRRQGISVPTPFIIHVTMPAPRDLTMVGPGEITTSALARQASVTIAGSGTINTPSVNADKLTVSITGSGIYNAAGHAKSLDLSMAGSGDADMAALRVDTAAIIVKGSGSSRLASDGKVSANIVGAGTATVVGRAQCSVSVVGSGSLVCARD